MARPYQISALDKILMGVMNQGPNRLVTQIRVLPTARRVPKADIVDQIRDMVERDPFFVRFRCMADVNTLTARELPSIDVTKHVRERSVPAGTMHGNRAHERVVNTILREDMAGDQPHWEIHTYTDGRENHGVVFRWNHWMGDGLATQMALARLFGYRFDLPDAVQARRADVPSSFREKLTAVKLSLLPRLNTRRSAWMSSHSSRNQSQDLADEAWFIPLPVSDLEELKAAGKRQNSSVTGILAAAGVETNKELQKRHGDAGFDGDMQIQTTMAFARNGDELGNAAKFVPFRVPPGSRATDIGRIYAEEVKKHEKVLGAESDFVRFLERKIGAQKLADDAIKELCSPQKIFDAAITTFPGPKKQIELCGVPVTSMFNCLGHAGIPTLTCTGYNGSLFPSLNASKKVGKHAEEVRQVWADSLATILSAD